MKKLAFIIVVVLLVISCKDEVKQKKKIDINNNNNNNNNNNIKIIFPDTVYIHKGYDGKIEYKSDLDTITTSLEDVKKYRYIEYYFLITKNKNNSEKFLKKIITDTAYADTNRQIPLLYIKFDKLGLNYFDGIITDEVTIVNGSKDKTGKPMTRIITHETRLTRGVYVVEKPKNKIYR